MPFTAFVENKIINLLREDHPEDFLNSKCLCRLCNEEMIVVIGKIIRSHFRHQKNSECKFISEPETKEHLALKALLDAMFFNSELEKLVEYNNKRYEIDVLLDKKYAIECQVSSCGIEYVEEKTHVYLKLGFIPVWIFYTKNPYSTNKPSRLHHVLRECFLNFGRFYGNIYPVCFLYSEIRNNFLVPVFIRQKILDDFSPSGFHNEYYLGDQTIEIEPNDFFNYLQRNTEDFQMPSEELKITDADFYFMSLKFPCYELMFKFANGKTHIQKIYEGEWGIKQLKTYANIKPKDDFFDADLLFKAKENVKKYIGRKGMLKTSKTNRLYFAYTDKT